MTIRPDSGRNAPPPTPWHALGPDEVLDRLGSTEDGLASAEATARLAVEGPNTVEVAQPISAFRVLWNQLRSVVVALLTGAALLALLLGDLPEAVAIAVVLLINVAIGFWTEWRARTAMEALRSLQVEHAVVVRDGEAARIEARDVVPGDVIVLEEGDAVPADARLLEAHELRVNEASLTGESVPVDKGVASVGTPSESAATTPVADRTSMVYKGTLAVAGSARAVVTGTGRRTEIGRVGELVGALDRPPSPIERRLDLLGRRLVWITLGIAVLVVLVGLLGGREIRLVVETAIALAIAAVPEGLAVVATVTLAIGMSRMARRNALVRRPPAVEALGSATVVCADKTGTLTSGRMAATALWVAGERIEVDADDDSAAATGGPATGWSERPEVAEVVRTLVLSNQASLEEVDGAWSVVGDPTEGALLLLGARAGLYRPELIEAAPEVGRLPFASQRMMMATFHEDSAGEVEALVKGAPDRVLERCSHWRSPEGPAPLTPELRKLLLDANDHLAAEGLRVLAAAGRRCGRAEVEREEALAELTVTGLVGLMDPPAPRAQETVARFHEAGVRTVMITGDHAATARAVSLELGVLREGDHVVSGPELAAMSSDELEAVVDRVAAYARVSPGDKVRIVDALHARGEVVGMLGDGVNDAPALKRADIGVAMGRRGTDVAKEVADVVLADDRLETVGVAVEEGRVIFDNIRKFIFYLFSCNLSEVGIVFVASIAGLPLPILPLQLLWLNVVTDVFPALALAAEPGESDIMSRPPRRPDAPILSRDFVTILAGYSGLITAVTLGVLLWGLREGGGGVERAVTLSFMTLAVAQLLHVLNARSFGPLPLGRALFRNAWLWGAIALGGALQLVAVYQPTVAGLLQTEPLGLSDWAVVGAAALVPLLAGQGWKVVIARRARPASPPARAPIRSGTP